HHGRTRFARDQHLELLLADFRRDVLADLDPFHVLELEPGADHVQRVVAAQVVEAGDAPLERKVDDFLAAELDERADLLARDEPVAHLIARRGDAYDRLALTDVRVGRDMVAGDEIDLAVEQGALRFGRARAEFHGKHFDADLLPHARLVHHLPYRQMRIGAEVAAYLDRFVAHDSSKNFTLTRAALQSPKAIGWIGGSRK